MSGFRKPPEELRIRGLPPESGIESWIGSLLFLTFLGLFLAGAAYMIGAGAWSLLGLTLLLFNIPIGVNHARSLARQGLFLATRDQLIMSRRWQKDWSEIEWISVEWRRTGELRVGWRGGPKQGRSWDLPADRDIEWWKFFDYIGTVAPHVCLLDRRDRDGAARKVHATTLDPVKAKPMICLLLSGFVFIISGLLYLTWISTDPDIADCDGRRMDPGDVCVSYSTGSKQTYSERLNAAESLHRQGEIIEPIVFGTGAFGLCSLIVLFLLLLRERTDWDAPEYPPVVEFQACPFGDR